MQSSTNAPLPLWRRFMGASAQAVLNGLGLNQPPVDPFRIARALGVQVYALPEHERKLSGMLFGEGDDVRIFVRASDSATRQRFTVAHELGHLLLHSRGGRVVAYRDTSFKGNPVEVEANRFAARLLMPAGMVTDLHRRSGGNLPLVAQAIGVSLQALEFRVQNIANGRG